MEAQDRTPALPAADRERLDRLLTQIAAGDRQALAELYELTRGAVYAAALTVLKDPQDAQDAAQDAFVRIWDSAGAGQYRSQGSPMAWILTVARNTARMSLRRSARQTDLDPEAWNAVPAQAPDVTAEDRLVLQQAMAALADQERQIVLLHAASGLKHREIAELLQLALPTVLSKYHRALKKLRAQLEGDDGP